jgi:hypothetical protein
MFRRFLIIFPFQMMEIPNVSMFSDYISIAKDGDPRCLEDFRLYRVAAINQEFLKYLLKIK